MAPKLFGFDFNDLLRKKEQEARKSPVPTGNALSPVPPENQDGALNVQYGGAGGYYGYYLDLDGSVADDFMLINRYREMQYVAEVDEAIDQIINEMVIQDAGRMPVSINLDNVTDFDEKTKIRIQAEFDGILKQMKFHKDAYSVVRQWYTDGRLYYHLVVDDKEPTRGIQEMRLVDPRCIKKVRELSRKRHQESQVDIIEVLREYYVYNPMGYAAPSGGTGVSTGTSASMLQYNGIKLTMESVAYVPSGLYDSTKKSVLSWLHKAIKPLNLLRMMEDSCVVYRIARAPERRVFYIDVGNLPKQKAEQYLYDIMQKYRNKQVYDVNTGEIRDDRKFMSIMEDFWLPRREGGKGTEITTLPAGQNLSEMEDVDYFRRKLYRSLNLPPSRIDQGTGFNLGRASEISRDELRFNKFIHRLQSQFCTVFDVALERQLRLKNILTEEEWTRIKDNVQYEWQQDSYFEELKSQEMWTSRLTLLTQIEPYLNTFFSSKWVTRNILKFTDDEWAAIHEEFDEVDAMTGEVDGEGPVKDDDELGFGKDEGDSPLVDDDEADDILGSVDDDGDDEDPLDKEADDLLSDDDDDEESDDDEEDDEESDDDEDDDDDEEDEDDDLPVKKPVKKSKKPTKPVKKSKPSKKLAKKPSKTKKPAKRD